MTETVEVVTTKAPSISDRQLKKLGEQLEYGRCYSTSLKALGCSHDRPFSTDENSAWVDFFKRRMARAKQQMKILSVSMLLLGLLATFLGYGVVAVFCMIIWLGLTQLCLSPSEAAERALTLFEPASDSMILNLAKWHEKEDRGEFNQYLNRLKESRLDPTVTQLDYYLWLYWFEKVKPKEDEKRNAEIALMGLIGEPLSRSTDAA